MSDKETERRLNAAIEVLTEGLQKREKHALANMIRSAHVNHKSLVNNAAGVMLPPEALKKQRYLFQAMANIGMCLTTLGDVLSGGQENDPRLGNIVAGLDRTICYVLGVPYAGRVFKSELDAALLTINEITDKLALAHQAGLIAAEEAQQANLRDEKGLI